MRALALRQPWASLVASGRKRIEVRTWRTRHRGPLVIVASSTVDREACARFGVADPPRSALVAIVDLVDVRPWRRGDARRACMPPVAEWHIDDFFAWVLSNPRPLVRRPFTRSRLMTFDIPARLVRVA